jgi:CheY-like chemotaxis protein
VAELTNSFKYAHGGKLDKETAKRLAADGWDSDAEAQFDILKDKDGSITPSQFEAAIVGDETHLASLKDLHILCVDDSFMCQVYVTMLKKIGCAHITVVTGESAGAEALEHMRNFQFDVLFVSYHLPDLNGFVLVEGLRDVDAVLERPQTPVVMITADMHNESSGSWEPTFISRASSLAVCVLKKPIAISKLKGVLHLISTVQLSASPASIFDSRQLSPVSHPGGGMMKASTEKEDLELKLSKLMKGGLKRTPSFKKNQKRVKDALSILKHSAGEPSNYSLMSGSRRVGSDSLKPKPVDIVVAIPPDC